MIYKGKISLKNYLKYIIERNPFLSLSPPRIPEGLRDMGIKKVSQTCLEFRRRLKSRKAILREMITEHFPKLNKRNKCEI